MAMEIQNFSGLVKRSIDYVRVARDHWRELAAFTAGFRLLEFLLLIPLTMHLHYLLFGAKLIDSTELVNYFLSPRGMFATLFGVWLTISLRILEEAGLQTVIIQALAGRQLTGLEALRLVVSRMPHLLLTAAISTVFLFALASPVIGVGAWFVWRLLPRHDINYYLAEWPPEFVFAVGLLLIVSIPVTVVVFRIAVRWRMVIAVSMSENVTPWGAFLRSIQLAKGHWWQIAGAWILVTLVIALLGIASWWIGELFSWSIRRWIGAGTTIGFGVYVAVLIGRMLVTVAVNLFGCYFNAAVLSNLYFRLRKSHGESIAEAPSVSTDQAHRRRSTGALLFVVILIVVAFSGSCWSGLSELFDKRVVNVTVHRGLTVNAVENTLEAIEGSIEEGAQYVEIDVQLSADGFVVLKHDRDFSRLAGIHRNVREMTWDEMSEIELRQSRDGQTITGRVATLAEALQTAQNRIRINIELKYFGDDQPELARRVVEEVRAAEMLDHVIVQSFKYDALQEIRQLEPRIPIGYLFAVRGRRPPRLEVDFLSAQSSRVNWSMVDMARRHGQEVHVWTVNTRQDAQRCLELGVDNLITDEPSIMLQQIDEWTTLSPYDRFTRRLKSWLIR